MLAQLAIENSAVGFSIVTIGVALRRIILSIGAICTRRAGIISLIEAFEDHIGIKSVHELLINIF